MVCRRRGGRNPFQLEGCTEEVESDMGFENCVTLKKVEGIRGRTEGARASEEGGAQLAARRRYVAASYGTELARPQTAGTWC